MSNSTKRGLFFSLSIVCAVISIVLLLRMSVIMGEIQEENIYNFNVNLEMLNLLTTVLYALIALTIILVVFSIIVTSFESPFCIKATKVIRIVILIILLLVAIGTLMAFILDISKIDNTDRTLSTVEEVLNYSTIFSKFIKVCQFVYNTFVIIMMAIAFGYFATIEKNSIIVNMEEHPILDDKKSDMQQKSKEEIDAILNDLNVKLNTTNTKTEQKVYNKPTAQTNNLQQQTNQTVQKTVNPSQPQPKIQTVQKTETKPVMPIKPSVAQQPKMPPKPPQQQPKMPPKMPPKPPQHPK